ncbi:hypothetical protein DAPPUDRAFT_105312 [Daphnia pulex]|uniref:Uncharacterized protein n=1 Tax=Daphnia pulex TaxID=6669 RepID=E9GQ80_DAPPU|nr:hypothetical protein DAPPUDRAFT_105312 [Daphnia pulex]|eukprot:EFX78083.1 hypothetical protein DAPPUDRAFT_105312 [Daphnia pulex]
MEDMDMENMEPLHQSPTGPGLAAHRAVTLYSSSNNAQKSQDMRCKMLNIPCKFLLTHSHKMRDRYFSLSSQPRRIGPGGLESSLAAGYPTYLHSLSKGKMLSQHQKTDTIHY